MDEGCAMQQLDAGSGGVCDGRMVLAAGGGNGQAQAGTDAGAARKDAVAPGGQPSTSARAMAAYSERSIRPMTSIVLLPMPALCQAGLSVNTVRRY